MCADLMERHDKSRRLAGEILDSCIETEEPYYCIQRKKETLEEVKDSLEDLGYDEPHTFVSNVISTIEVSEKMGKIRE